MRRLLASTLRVLFVIVAVYPVVLLWLGRRVRHMARLPMTGPAIVVANHNSHFDTLVLLSLFPLSNIADVHPVAAADYFLANPWLRWFSLRLVGIVPVRRGSGSEGQDPLEACYRALDAGKVLVLFPEGTRGEPEQMAELKSGIWHLAKRFPHVPVVPIFMYGAGKSMPKGRIFPLPFVIKVTVGRPLHGNVDKNEFLALLRGRLLGLRAKTLLTHEHETL